MLLPFWGAASPIKLIVLSKRDEEFRNVQFYFCIFYRLWFPGILSKCLFVPFVIIPRVLTNTGTVIVLRYHIFSISISRPFFLLILLYSLSAFNYKASFFYTSIPVSFLWFNGISNKLRDYIWSTAIYFSISLDHKVPENNIFFGLYHWFWLIFMALFSCPSSIPSIFFLQFFLIFSTFLLYYFYSHILLQIFHLSLSFPHRLLVEFSLVNLDDTVLQECLDSVLIFFWVSIFSPISFDLFLTDVLLVSSAIVFFQTFLSLVSLCNFSSFSLFICPNLISDTSFVLLFLFL